MLKSKLSDASQEKINSWLKKFPKEQKQSAIIPALTIVQEENGGYLTDELKVEVAKYLNVPEINVFEVASFYSMFEHKPVGKNKISVCTNISCMLCNCKTIVDHLKNRLNIDFNETTKDGKFFLKEVECLAACGGAPAMLVNKTYYENLTPEKVDKILQELK